MTRDEIKQIADIVGGDSTYRHFVNRINKEFEAADADRNAQVKVLLQTQDGGDVVGFSVIGISPSKMKTWETIFKVEGWVDEDFQINLDSHELMYMYIKPEYRHQGYGAKLLSTAFEHAKSKGAHNVYAYVSDRDNTSLEFYKKNMASVIYDFSDEGITTAFVTWTL